MGIIFGLIIGGKKAEIAKSFGESFGGWEDIEKALSHKYIRRWPDPKNPKKWRYLYPRDFLKPLLALKSLFGVKEDKISKDYDENNIKKDYGADKKTFAAHVLEYLSNKLKWDTFFAKKENRDANKAPKKSPSGGGKGGKKGGSVDKTGKEGDNKIVLNRSLMRRIWGIYNKTEEENGRNNIDAGSGKLSDGTPAVRSGGSEEAGNQYVSGAQTGDNGGEPVQLPIDNGERPARDVRVTKKQTRNIRESCIALLNSKSDDEMTEEDKALLRQYEGAGGLGEEDASVHGTLYEYYTPRTVTKKVWEIVDKYLPGAKNVLEPSAGIGRFAEDRPNDTFTLNEYDKISSRIARILHPDTDVKQGAFQEMFKAGKPYDGKKYDVVIGNPPYGKYEGLWKGRGEGKDHSRYEEYFIDRGLDTLREGGIMAFVVPSTFLRGGNDKIKEKIAAKGRLLEAWRLPNGTFNTTGVGTDIIVVRKEKGDPAAFSDNAYFESNPGMVVGSETTRTGRFGKLEKYISLKDGESFDEAIEGIRADAVEAVPLGQLSAGEEAQTKVKVKIEKKPKRSLSEAMRGNQNAAGPHDVDSLAEFNKKYNKNIPEAAVPIWKATAWDGSINTGELSDKDIQYLEKSRNYVKAADGKWYDVVNFASGNIYLKLQELERDKDKLSETEYKRQKTILEAAKPTPKTVFEFTVSPIDDFASKYVMEEDLNGKQDSLVEAFKSWVWDLPPSSIPTGIGKNDITDYVNRKSVRADSRNQDKAAAARERDNTIKIRRDAAEGLFNQYVREQLSTHEQARMADMWNKRFNAVVDADHTKIPAFVDGISKTFKGKPLTVSDIQLKGVATLVNRGNGILAYDVGVGKTLTGILATVSQIQTGRAKRPLICVPKAVYTNWLSEIRQLFPNIKINELYNFRGIDEFRNETGGLNIEEGTLSVCTYEALEQISFKQETIDNELMADMLDSQFFGDEDDSQRDQASQIEKIQTTLGRSTKSGDNQINWEDAGFDHITIDELHNMKNVFQGAKSKEKGKANEFQSLTGSTPSNRALKTFAVTQMIQRRNNGRNVFGLTATPFTNSPIEIYNILSLVAREKLKEAGIYNLHEFMAQFAALKTELAPDSKGDVVEKTIMKEFKNLSALQKLINTYIDKVDGEEANIIRPERFPYTPDINMTGVQKEVAAKIVNYMVSADPKEDPGATLKGINALRALALSPRLVDGTMLGDIKISIPSDMGNFVTSSPKMTFVCDSASTLYKQHPDQGQVIYLPRGVKNYNEVKEYLVKKGVDPESIAFISPEWLPTGKNKEGEERSDIRKDEIMKDFNDPNGKIKIIIGSETIMEGVNLNGNTTTLYNCMLGWNPTETIQVEGRIHRQGNKQGHVHIVYPLMNDSIDSFMYQKHDEKAKRISAIFSYKGDTLDVGGIDPEELKFGLIKDPAKRADLQIKQEVEGIKNRVLLAQATSDKITDTYATRQNFQLEITESTQQIDSIKNKAKGIAEMSDEDLLKEYGNKYSDDDESLEHRFSEFDGVKGSAWIEGKNAKEFRKEFDKMSRAAVQYLQKYISSAKSKCETADNTLKRYGIDPNNEKSVEDTAKKYGKEAAKLNQQIEKIQSSRNTRIAALKVKIAEEAKPGFSADEATKLITGEILTNLRPMEEVEPQIRARREASTKASGVEVKKSVLFVINERIVVRRGA
jgi:hypothetical protein